MHDFNKKMLFHDLLNSLDIENKADLYLRYQHILHKDMALHRYEMEQLKKEVVEEVLSRISVSADTKNAIKEINSLNAAIKQLGK